MDEEGYDGGQPMAGILMYDNYIPYALFSKNDGEVALTITEYAGCLNRFKPRHKLGL